MANIFLSPGGDAAVEAHNKLLQFVTAPRARATQTLPTMSTGFALFDKILAIVAFVWIFYWILSLTLRPREKRINRKKG